MDFVNQDEISDFENVSPKLLAVNLEFDKKMAKMFLSSFSKEKLKQSDLNNNNSPDNNHNILNTSKSLTEITQDLLEKDTTLNNNLSPSSSQLLLLLEATNYSKIFQEAEKNKNDPQ